MDDTDYLKVELQPGSEYDSVNNCFPSHFTIVKVIYLFFVVNLYLFSLFFIVLFTEE